MQVTVVLPAYNEARDLRILLFRIAEALSAAKLEYQILLVDDGSTDETVAVAKEASTAIPIRICQHETNKGLGGAIATAIKEVVKEEGVAVIMDADNTHDPKLILQMLSCLNGSPQQDLHQQQGADVVIASRFCTGGQQLGVSIYRRTMSLVLSKILQWCVRYDNVTDYSSGYRAYRIQTLRRLVEVYGENVITERGFTCMLELLLKLRTVGAKVEEVPMILRYDFKLGASKMRVFRTILQYGGVLYRYFLHPQQRQSVPEWSELPKLRKVANS